MCVLPAIALLALYAHLNWNVVGQPPYYDEMWKFDLIVPSGTVARYFAHDTPIPIGWLFLNKAILFFTPDNFAVARISCALWAALATALLAWRMSPASPINWRIVAGVLFLATCTPVHSVIRNFNQYSLEILYSVSMVCIAMSPIENARLRLTALVWLAAAPLFTISSVFFLPGVFAVMFWNSGTRRNRIEVLATAAAAATVAALVYLLWYRPIVTGPGLPVVYYWQDYIVRRSMEKILAAVARFPSEFLASLTDGMPPAGLLRSIESTVILLIVALGYVQLWRYSRTAAALMGAAVVTALGTAFTVTWPLVFFGESRVNLGWVWVLYVCLGIGAATIISVKLKPASVPFVVLAGLIGAITLGPTWTRHEPDTVPFRGLYKDIARILNNPGSDQVIVQLHFMAHFYPDFEINVRRPDTFSFLREMRDDPEIVAQLPERLSAFPNAKTIWIVHPFQRGPETWTKLKALTLPGFVRAPDFTGFGADIAKFER